MIVELSELESPAGDEAQVQRFLGKFKSALVQAEANPESLLTGNPFLQAGEDASVYGLKACA